MSWITRYPIIQAPMAGGATTPALVAAVSNAGGLGSLAAGYMEPDEIKKTIRKIKALTNYPFAVNLFVPETPQASESAIEHMAHCVEACCHELHFHVKLVSPPYTFAFEEQLRAILDEAVPVFSFTFGIPDEKYLISLKKKKYYFNGNSNACR